MSKLVFYIGVPPEKELVEQAMNGLRVLGLKARRILVRDYEAWKTMFPDAVWNDGQEFTPTPLIAPKEADLQAHYEGATSLLSFDCEIPAGAMVVEAE